MKGKLIIFSAPSGSGKTTIVHHLLKKDLNLRFSVSACSREKRSNEVHGQDYFFISPDEFRKKIETNDFLEWEEVYHNQFYGTLKSEVEGMRELGHNVLFDIDVVGGLNLKKQFGDEALAVFVMPPSVKELENRLRKRNTDSEEKIAKRLDKAAHELDFAHQFDVVLLNDHLEKSLLEAEIVVGNFLAKP
jgi:guanylate kinase